MPKINKKSEWRARTLKHYQSVFMEELPLQVKAKEKWRVQDVWHKMQCINHLSDSYAFDIAVAIVIQAYEDGVLGKIGSFYFLKEKEKRNVGNTISNFSASL